MALECRQERDPVCGLLGERVEKMPDPPLAHPWGVGVQCPGAGQQRAGEAGDLSAHPVAGERGANRRPLAALVEPGVHAEGGAEQRRMPVSDSF